MSVISTLSVERRVVVVVDGDFPGAGHPEARRVIDAVSGARALVVAPAGPVAGERWVVDLSARAEQARRQAAPIGSGLRPRLIASDRSARRRAVAGQLDVHRRSCPDLGFGPDAAPVGLDDRAGDREAEPASAAVA
jgi:hypothetical protein